VQWMMAKRISSLVRSARSYRAAAGHLPYEMKCGSNASRAEPRQTATRDENYATESASIIDNRSSAAAQRCTAYARTRSIAAGCDFARTAEVTFREFAHFGACALAVIRESFSRVRTSSSVKPSSRARRMKAAA